MIDSSGAVCAALYFFANDTAAIASPTTNQYDYYLTAPENYYGLPAGLVKLAWETTLPDSANAPGCGSGGSGTGTVTSFSFTDGGGFTGTVLNPTTTPTLSLVLQDAAADGATKGQGNYTRRAIEVGGSKCGLSLCGAVRCRVLQYQGERRRGGWVQDRAGKAAAVRE